MTPASITILEKTIGSDNGMDGVIDGTDGGAYNGDGGGMIGNDDQSGMMDGEGWQYGNDGGMIGGTVGSDDGGQNGGADDGPAVGGPDEVPAPASSPLSCNLDMKYVGKLAARTNAHVQTIVNGGDGYMYAGTASEIIQIRLSDHSVAKRLTTSAIRGQYYAGAIDRPNGFGYFVTDGDTVLVKVRLSDMTLVGSLTFGQASGWDRSMTIDQEGGKLYVGIQGKIRIIDLGSFTEDSVIDITSQDRADVLAVDPSAGYLYAGGQNGIHKISLETGLIVGKVAESGIASLAIDREGGALYAGSYTAITKISLDTFTKVGWIQMQNSDWEYEFVELALDHSRNRLYSVTQYGHVVQYELSSFTRLGRILMPIGANSYSYRVSKAAYDPASGALIATQLGNAMKVVMDADCTGAREQVVEVEAPKQQIVDESEIASCNGVGAVQSTADGGAVLFATDFDSVVNGDIDRHEDLFLRLIDENRTIQVAEGPIRGYAMNADGNVIAYEKEDGVRVLDRNSGTTWFLRGATQDDISSLHPTTYKQSWIYKLSISADGRYVMVGHFGAIHFLYDLETRERHTVYHPSSVQVYDGTEPQLIRMHGWSGIAIVGMKSGKFVLVSDANSLDRTGAHHHCEQPFASQNNQTRTCTSFRALVPGDTNTRFDAYMKRVGSPVYERLSIRSDGGEARCTWDNGMPTMSEGSEHDGSTSGNDEPEEQEYRFPGDEF